MRPTALRTTTAARLIQRAHRWGTGGGPNGGGAGTGGAAGGIQPEAELVPEPESEPESTLDLVSETERELPEELRNLTNSTSSISVSLLDISTNAKAARQMRIADVEISELC